jgi:predicted adenylyl cyclase CyaB
MPQNLEIKARIPSLSDAENSARRLPAKWEGVLKQRDTYFAVPNGRLKLREIEGKQSELIFYDRPEADSQRWSTYTIYPTSDPGRLLTVLQSAFTIRGIVEKERTLYLYENARIHLDAVRHLGSFLEFEVIVGSSREQAGELMMELRAAFSITEATIIRCSYIDFF